MMISAEWTISRSSALNRNAIVVVIKARMFALSPWPSPSARTASSRSSAGIRLKATASPQAFSAK